MANNFVANTVDIEIEDITPAGDGVGRHGSLQITVPFTIPGERVRVRPGVRRGGSATALLVDVLRPSPHRITAPCPHFGPSAAPGPCGGCSWQHIAYPEQLRLKTAIVRGLVAGALRMRPPDAHPTIPATAVDDPWRYRSKVHFVFGSAGRSGTPVMGHFIRGSRRVLPVCECPVHDPRGNAFAFRLRDEMVGAEGADTLKHVVVRVGVGTSETMAMLVVVREGDRRLRAATRRVLSSDVAPTSCHLNLHPRNDAYLFGRETRRLSGSERMREEVAGVSFLISPTSFFQTNIKAAEILVRLVMEMTPEGVPVLDLYAGAGLFALPLARRGHHVIAIEESRSAVADGLASLRLNRIPSERCRFVAGRVEAALRRIEPTEARVIVLDPPREGCESKVLDAVFGRLRPERAVYVSCNPETLARDLGIIERYGYRPTSLQPVDMFPHTAHIETVAVVSRSS